MMNYFLSETTMSRVLIFCMYHHPADFYQVHSNNAHGAKKWPTFSEYCNVAYQIKGNEGQGLNR